MPKTYLSLLITLALSFNCFVIAAPITQTIEQLEQDAHLPQEQARFYYAKGLDYLNTNKLINARIAFEKSLSFEPGHIKSILGLAETLFKLDEIEAATKQIETAASIAPNDPHVLISLARTNILQGQFNDSETALLKAIDADPKLFKAHIDLADLYSIHLKDYKQAAKYYESAAKLDPKHAGAHYGLGVSFKHINNKQDAITALSKSAELAPKIPLPHQALAELYLSDNKPRQAQKHFQTAKQLDPGYADAYFSLADYYMGLGDTKQALHEIDTLIKHTPALAEAYLRRGIIHNSINDTPRAKADYQQAIKNGTNNPIAFNNLAWLLATNEQNYGKAIELSDKANKLAPDNAGFLDTLGWVHHLSGHHKQARETLTKAIELSPDAPEILYHLALVQRKLGNNNAAKTLFEKALKAGPNQGLAAAIEAAINN